MVRNGWPGLGGGQPAPQLGPRCDSRVKERLPGRAAKLEKWTDRVILTVAVGREQLELEGAVNQPSCDR